MEPKGVFERFVATKFLSQSDFWTLAMFTIVNPFIVVAIDWIFGFPMLLGIMVGITAVLAIKTDWRRDG